ncbi:Hypothetical protein FKW44_002855 [Caligus rogercresseyi]|uniref:Uncharacterized protein n=1 Tax=Caligus rogercresseyi TaxID=217165 RepID=A0A7T8KKT7_CALRO|nr:Hypothetical protein FKW44_002855 [Caligus rogercresseyi]
MPHQAPPSQGQRRPRATRAAQRWTTSLLWDLARIKSALTSNPTPMIPFRATGTASLALSSSFQLRLAGLSPSHHPNLKRPKRNRTPNSLSSLITTPSTIPQRTLLCAQEAPLFDHADPGRKVPGVQGVYEHL